MTTVDPYAPQETKFRREFLFSAAMIFMPLAALLIPYADVDLAVSAAAKTACHLSQPGGGPWCPTFAVTTARQFFMFIFGAIAIATVAVTVRTLLAKRRWFGREQARCWFMIAVLIAGPGLVANLVFKDNLGRARPRDVVEFGGTKAFTPPLIPSRECPRNCSFISGESSSMFAAFFALALLLPQYRIGLLAVGIAAGTLAGAVRIIQGAHFLSDVLFSGVIMAMTVSLLHIAIVGIWRSPRRTWNILLVPVALLTRTGVFERARG